MASMGDGADGRSSQILSAGSDRALRVFSTARDSQSREVSQGPLLKRARKMQVRRDYAFGQWDYASMRLDYAFLYGKPRPPGIRHGARLPVPRGVSGTAPKEGQADAGASGLRIWAVGITHLCGWITQSMRLDHASMRLDYAFLYRTAFEGIQHGA
jgi:hypothetical protein